MNDPIRRIRDGLGDWMAAPAMFVSPIIGYLKFNDYSLLAPEALLAIGTFLAAGFVMSLAVHLMWSPIRVATMTLTSFIVLYQVVVGTGVQVPGEPINTLAGMIEHGFTAIVSIGAVIWLFFFWLRVRFANLLCTFVFGVMAMSVALTPTTDDHEMTRVIKKQVAINRTLSPILHIILDEHQGLAGFPRDIAGGTDLAKMIEKHHRDRGFVVYPNAYSSYAQTVFAIPALLNNQAGRAAVGTLTWANDATTARQNNWLTVLAKREYQVRVYGSKYLDFCQDDAVAFCQLYSTNSIHSLIEADLPTLKKYRVILDKFDDGVKLFWFTSAVIDVIKTKFFGWSPNTDSLWQRNAPRLSPFAAFSMIQDIVKDIENGAAGKVFFIHLILPHYSYVFEDDCRIVEDEKQWLNRTQRSGYNSPNGRKERYKRYFKQTRCLHTALTRIYDALASTGLYEMATIIVHGDHGSRIGLLDVNAKTVNRVSSQDLIDAYSTLYIVKRPNQVGATNLETRSVQDLFGEQFLGAAATPKSILYLRDEKVGQQALDPGKPLGTVAVPPGFPQAQ